MKTRRLHSSPEEGLAPFMSLSMTSSDVSVVTTNSILQLQHGITQPARKKRIFSKFV